ncbi:hypothetical protein HOO54_15685 [Bacillus sp. WMMC1349]|uniref:hypothetical protein n=1 Tax=Bacillus sp. WMMC1349 TaxID=2736254 RepID=UPI001553E859|nr:hypothetical protein [Bacillus sp. WMMC1349]
MSEKHIQAQKYYVKGMKYKDLAKIRGVKAGAAPKGNQNTLLAEWNRDNEENAHHCDK